MSLIAREKPDRMATQIRLDEAIFYKTKAIADKEMRSLNAQMEYFIKKCVEQYEQEFGVVKVEIFE